MRKLTIAVSLRILLLITFIFHLFAIVDSHTGQLYSLFSLSLVSLLIFIQQYKYKKSRLDGRSILKEFFIRKTFGSFTKTAP